MKHAEKEMRLAGLYDADADYGGMLAPAVLEMVKQFASEGHSGASAEVTLGIFNRVARFKTLSPLTDNSEEWMDVSETSGGNPMWQSTRQYSCFSTDGGRTYYDLDEKGRPAHESKKIIGDSWEPNDA